MTVRRWLWAGSGSPGQIREVTDAEITTHHSTYSEYAFSSNPPTTLTVVGSGGNLSGLPMSDTRYQAGSYTTRVDRFSTEAETPNISIVTVNYSRISQTIYTSGEPPDTDNLRWPLYVTPAGDLRAMSSTDFYDTFVAPALTLVSGSSAGDYLISTSTSVAGATLVSATPVYVDTRANTGAYSAPGIPEAQDQPTTVNTYYLHRTNGGVSSVPGDTGRLPLYLDPSDEQIKQHTVATWSTLLGAWLQYELAQPGSTPSYSINGTGTTQGSAMINTILSPTGTGYTQRFVNADDYRTQEFPNGTPVTANTYELKKTTV